MRGGWEARLQQIPPHTHTLFRHIHAFASSRVELFAKVEPFRALCFQALGIWALGKRATSDAVLHTSAEAPGACHRVLSSPYILSTATLSRMHPAPHWVPIHIRMQPLLQQILCDLSCHNSQVTYPTRVWVSFFFFF
jgi:hypothetical protein